MKLVSLFPLLLIFVYAGCTPLGSSGLPVTQELRLSSRHPLRWCSAHRGRLEGFPENSLIGLEHAAKKGVRLLEVDVRRTSDGQLILFHDGTLKQKNFEGSTALYGSKIDSLSFNKLREGHLPFTQDIKIPLLSEALRAVRPFRSVLQLDVKKETREILTQIVKTVQAESMLDRVLIQCRKIENAQFLNRNFPWVALDIRVDQEEKLITAINLSPHVVELEGWRSKDAARQLRQAKIRSLFNLAPSEYDTEEMKSKLFDESVDIVMTDYADKSCE